MKIDLPQQATGLQERASSRRAPANAENEFGYLNDLLAERSARLRTSSFSTQHINAIEPTSHFALGSLRGGHILVGSLLLILFASLAVVSVWGLPFQLSQLLPISRAEPDKPAATTSDKTEQQAVLPISAPSPSATSARSTSASPPIAAPPAPPPLVSQEPDKSTSELPLDSSAAAISTPPSVSPGPAPLTGGDKIRELQNLLKTAGFDPGPVDGIAGPLTLSAVRKFAEARNIASADLTQDLLTRLRTEAQFKR